MSFPPPPPPPPGANFAPPPPPGGTYPPPPGSVRSNVQQQEHQTQDQRYNSYAPPPPHQQPMQQPAPGVLRPPMPPPPPHRPQMHAPPPPPAHYGHSPPPHPPMSAHMHPPPPQHHHAPPFPTQTQHHAPPPPPPQAQPHYGRAPPPPMSHIPPPPPQPHPGINGGAYQSHPPPPSAAPGYPPPPRAGTTYPRPPPSQQPNGGMPYPPPHQPSQTPREASGRIDPSQIPRPPLFTRPQDDSAIPIYFPRKALQLEEPPPPADSRFLSQDDGNTIPQLMRSVLSTMPLDKSILRQTTNMMGLLVSPLAILPFDHTVRPRLLPDGSEQDGWTDAMRVPSAQGPPPRCSRCNAYVNAAWDDSTGKCNFCGAINRDLAATPPMYGTVEYAVSGPYVTRPTPVEPIFLYALDATCPHLESYLPILNSLGHAMANHYTTNNNQTQASAPPPRIGILLVSAFGVYVPQWDKDGTLGFAVVSDVTEQPFCPIPVHNWTLDVLDPSFHDTWDSFTTEHLTQEWKPFVKQLDEKTPYDLSGFALTCGGAALEFMADALQTTGGRATWISWRRPNFGVGMIRDRERNNLGLYRKSDTEQRLYVPLQKQSKLEAMDVKTAAFYNDLAQRCAKNRIAIDVVIHTMQKPNSFLDIATLGEVCRITGGRLKWIRRAFDWKDQLLEEFKRPVLGFFGTDAILKIRCSQGLQVKSYLSSTSPGVTIDSIMGSPELELGFVGQDTTIAVELEHKIGGLPKNDKLCHIQSALLYTTRTGQRRVRVSTLSLRVGLSATAVYKGVDLSAMTAFLTRQTISSLYEKSQDEDFNTKDVKRELMEKVTQALAGYRINTNAKNLALAQLLLPEKLQLLPLFTTALLKSNMFRAALPLRGSGLRTDHASPTGDERAYALFYGAVASSPACSMLMVHPNIFSLTQLMDGAGELCTPVLETQQGSRISEVVRAAYHEYVQLPKSVNPSIACIEDDQIYLIDNGMSIFIFIGQTVGPEVKKELFERTDIHTQILSSSDFGQQVKRLVWQMRTFTHIGGGAESMLRPTYAPIVVVFGDKSHSDPFEEKITTLMVDDLVGGEQDYPAFLCDIHKIVQNMVSNKVRK